MSAEMEAYHALSIDNYYLGYMKKAEFYDHKFKYGEFEGPSSVVRKVAVGIVKNRIDMVQKGRQREKIIDGKVIKQSFDKMPSPSSFGGGIALKLKMAANDDGSKIIPVNRADYERHPRKEKPFAEFRRPELAHLNISLTKDYLKQPKKVKIQKKPKDIVQPTGVFKVKKFDKGKPFSDTDF